MSDERYRLFARRTLDIAHGFRSRASGFPQLMDRLSEQQERRRVVVLSVCHRGADCLAASVEELLSSQHAVDVSIGCTAPEAPPALRQFVRRVGLEGGRTHLLNNLWFDWLQRREEHPDWLLLLDDDVRLPKRFLDRFVALAERLNFTLCQPAQSRRSHAGWPVARRHWGALARTTCFTEIGPLPAIRQEAIATIMPLAETRQQAGSPTGEGAMGWGIDLHWAWLARQHNWRQGVIDALPVRHEGKPVGSGYSLVDAKEAERRFLAEFPHLPHDEVNTTLETYRRLS